MSQHAEITSPATRLGEEPLVHPTAVITQSTLGRFTEITEHCKITETDIVDYSYVM